MPDKQTEEKRQHSTAFIPYSYYECRIPYDFMNVPMHWHSEFELNYIVRGAGEFICDSEKFLCKEGDILVLPPNMLHSAYPCPQNDLIFQALVFHPVMLGTNINDRCTAECIRPLINGTVRIHTVFTSQEEYYPDLKSSISRIFSCVTDQIPHADLLLKSELMHLFWLLETNPKCHSRQKSGLNDCELIRPALEYMVKNYKETVSVEQLADISHLSKSYFMNCFKKAAGISAMEYLSQLRISAACEALSFSGHKVSDIAFRCGYDNLSNFNRQFKKIAGCSPREYRKRIAAQERISIPQNLQNKNQKAKVPYHETVVNES